MQGLREADPDSARVFEQIVSDEERHLKYCEAIARRYAPSREVHEQTLQHFRRVEAKVFARNSQRNMEYALEHGLLDLSLAERIGWRIVSMLGSLIDPSRPTPFMNQPLQPVLAEATQRRHPRGA